MLVSVLGDSTIDLVARPSAPLRAGGDVPAAITLGPGGQGANVAVRLARRGHRVRLVTALADDEAGRLLAAALAAERVELVPQSARRSGVVVSLLDADGERTMLSDRASLDPGAVAVAAAGADWVHASGYLLADDEVGDATAGALGSLDPAIRVSLAGGSFRPGNDRAGRLRSRIGAADPDLLVFSSAEVAALLGGEEEGPSSAASALAAAFPGRLAVVTGGARGSAAAGHGSLIEVTAGEPRISVVDATGAGDAYAAALIGSLAGGNWPPDEASLRTAMAEAGRLGALVCGVVGAQGRVDGEPDPVP
jgi:sugar/nucleoside kinase (ribokinase family)